MNELRTKQSARKSVYRAVGNGSIVKPSSCSKCGNKKLIQAHHSDYAKPLEVVWLCYLCHRSLHIHLGTWKNQHILQAKSYSKHREIMLDLIYQESVSVAKKLIQRSPSLLTYLLTPLLKQKPIIDYNRAGEPIICQN